MLLNLLQLIFDNLYNQLSQSQRTLLQMVCGCAQ